MKNFTVKAGQKLSHAYIVLSPSPQERDAAALRLAAAMICTGSGDRPCGLCRACRLVFGAGHADVIPVMRETDDKGKLRRGIRVDQIRELTADAYTMPVEARKKVFIVYEADLMNVQAQNAFLKLLEEPPDTAAFILSAGNAADLLPTVRSRCVTLRISGEGKADGEFDEPVREFLRLAGKGDRAALLEWCMGKASSYDGAETAAFISAARVAAAGCVCGSRESCGLSGEEAVKLCELLALCGKYTAVNTGARHIFGLLAASAISK